MSATGDSKELLLRAAAGDRSALRQLVQLHEPSLFAFVRARASPALRARESVRDILQDVLVELVQDVARVEYRDEAAFRGWLYTMAERRIRDRARFHSREKRARVREVSLEDDEARTALLAQGYSGLSSPSRRLQRIEEIAQLERAFERLSDADREVLTLAFFCGMSSPQIAAHLGIAEELARKRKNRARIRLAALWAEIDDADQLKS